MRFTLLHETNQQKRDNNDGFQDTGYKATKDSNA